MIAVRIEYADDSFIGDSEVTHLGQRRSVVEDDVLFLDQVVQSIAVEIGDDREWLARADNDAGGQLGKGSRGERKGKNEYRCSLHEVLLRRSDGSVFDLVSRAASR